jgi:NAD(P)-dependent dehydrogenase (short-subunit alcohol dehydrogenase family)
MAGRFFYAQLFVTPPKPTTPQTGKTVIITGSNTGLGKEAARHFVRLGASKVILAVRSLEKGEAAKRDIESTTHRQNVVEVWKLDMSSYQSVLDFGKRATTELDRLDIALLNAGMMPAKWTIYEQDEAMITVNLVTQFLLAFALLPRMISTYERYHTRPTLSMTVSETHEWALFPERHAPNVFERLQMEEVDGKKVDMMRRYELSKLLAILCLRAMCERMPSAQLPVSINCVNPGLCHS